MTKKRRNLRILASIIAAGCVWTTGMGSVWADVISGTNITIADVDEYIAIKADLVEYDSEGNIASGNVLQTEINTLNGYLDDNNVSNDNNKVYRTIDMGSDNITQGIRGQYYLYRTKEKNNNEYQYYWVQDGYTIVTSNHNPIIQSTTTSVIDNIYGQPSGNFKPLSTVQVHEDPTNVTTVLGDNLDDVTISPYGAASNSGTYEVADNMIFVFNQGTAEMFVIDGNKGAGGVAAPRNYKHPTNGDNTPATAFTDANFKTIGEGDDNLHYDPISQSYTYQEKHVHNNSVYVVNVNGQSKAGIFVINGKVYDGTIHGNNGEILLTGQSNTGGTGTVLKTYWGAENDNFGLTVADSNMTIGNVREAYQILKSNDDDLAKADIKEIVLTSVANTNSGTINLLHNDEVEGAQGTAGQSATNVPGGITVTGGGGNINENRDTYIKFFNDANRDGFTINTGSVVVATSTTQNQIQNEPEYLNRITINGTEYIIGNAGYQWNVGYDNDTTDTTAASKEVVKMDDSVIFTSSDGNLQFVLSDDGQNPSKTTIDVQLSDNIKVENVTTQTIKLGDSSTNNTTIQYNNNDNRITYGDNSTTYQVAHLGDGMTFVGDDVNTLVNVDLNKKVRIYGGATEYATGNNIGVVASSDGDNGAELQVKLAKNLTGLNSIETKTITATDTIKVGDSTSNVTINNKSIQLGDVQVSYNEEKNLTVNNKKITNVAPGEINETSTDVVVGSQLYQVQQEINAGNAQLSNRLDRLGNRVDKVGAGAAALAALHPMDFDPDDKLQFSAGVGNYRGETAAALGAFYRPTEKVMFSVAGTMGNDDNMVSAGVTFALDRKNNVSNSRVAMAHEIQDLREQVAALTALVSQIAGKGNPLLDTVMFPDVPENHWAYDYVESLQKRGIIEGYPDGNFAGDRSMTRYEYAAMLYRALEKGFPVDGRLLKEFEAELGRIRIDRIKGTDDDANKVERVRVNDYEGRDDYGSKLAQVVADAAPVVEEELAA